MSGICLILIPLFGQFYILFINLIILGLAAGTFRPANMLLLISDAEPIERARIIGLNRVATNIGMAFSTAVGGLLAAINYNLIFWFDGLTSILAALLLIAYRNFYKDSQNIVARKSSIAIISLLKNKEFAILCVLLFLIGLSFFQIRSTYPVYLAQHYFITTKMLGYLFSLNCLIIILFEVPLLTVLKNFNQIIIAAIGSLLITASMIILLFGNYLWLAIISCILWSLGEILCLSVMFVLAVKNAKIGEEGARISIYQTIFTATIMLAPTFGGAIYPFYDGKLLWLSCGIIGMIVLAGYRWLYIRTSNNDIK